MIGGGRGCAAVVALGFAEKIRANAEAPADNRRLGFAIIMVDTALGVKGFRLGYRFSGRGLGWDFIQLFTTEMETGQVADNDRATLLDIFVDFLKLSNFEALRKLVLQSRCNIILLCYHILII